MNYQQTLDYLFNQLPMYQRVGAAAYKVDLSNTHLLCEILNNPQNNFKSIHIAGTNGKGSTSHMLASILQEAGYKVGLYTSPHLKDFRERIKINGKVISEKKVVDFVEEYKTQFEKINLSFFEWTVGLAFDCFAEEQVDIAVVETGLGGRLDSTNVVNPEVSVITNIGIDHTQFLGETLEEIAFEKAGIIKLKTPVVIGETQEKTTDVFQKKAQEMNAKIYFADQENLELYKTDLKGNYQQKNLKTCLATVQVLNKMGGWKLNENVVKKGLCNVVPNTGLLGRWQILQQKPMVVCDTGHNKSGVKEIMAQIEETSHKKLHMVVGFVNDKSIDEVLELLSINALYYFCKANIPRALNADELKEKAANKGIKGDSYSSVSKALSVAKDRAHSDDLIFVGGSTFVVAEVL